MGFWDWLPFKKKSPSKLESMNLFRPSFSGSWSPVQNITFASICRAFARHISKIQPYVSLKGEIAQSKRYLQRLLSLRPNPHMAAPLFWETVALSFYHDFNAFIWIEYDYTNFKEPIKAFWILDVEANQFDVAKTPDGHYYVKFVLDGVEHFVDEDELILLSQNVKASEFFGKMGKAVEQTLRVLRTNYEGMEQAIKSSAYIRFLVKSPTPMSEDMEKKNAERISKTYLGQKDNSGVLYLSGAEITQVNTSPKTINAEELKIFKGELYEYFGCNEKFITGAYTEDDYQSVYEASLEPLILLIEAEFTYKLFSSGEISAGNRVTIDANRLHTASLKTRTMVADRLLKLPVIKPNMINELLFMPKTEAGEKEYMTLNYTEADDVDKPDEDNLDGDKKKPKYKPIDKPGEPKPKEEDDHAGK